LSISLALTASVVALDRHDFHVAQDIFLFVTYLTSLTLLINGSTANYLLVQLQLVPDPHLPPSRFETFIAIRKDMSLRQRLQLYLADTQHELGQYEEGELGSYCPILRKRVGFRDSSSQMSIIVNPLQELTVGEEDSKSAAPRVEKARHSISALDASIISFLRRTYLNVRIVHSSFFLFPPFTTSFFFSSSTSFL
jgi:hypothetical protein